MIKRIFLGIVFCLITIVFFHSCTNNSKQALLGNICDTTETKFSANINTVITAKCVSCHNNSSQSGGINLEGYDQVKNNTEGIIRTMKNGTMPKSGERIDDCTITKIQTWVNRGSQNN